LTIGGREYLPSKGIFRPLKPEIIVLEEFLTDCGITRDQLVDLAILVGTDFNEGVKGIGPKTALELVKTYGKIENMPNEIKAEFVDSYQRIRKLFLEPDVNLNYEMHYGELQEEMVYHFLCQERGFSKRRVRTAVERMKRFYSWERQSDLARWLD
jgi:flap endonuclease-1